MMIKESTFSFSSLIPSSAIFMRLRPSNGKGLVTTATVKIPISLATSATMGAAPVPVPPPIPAVIKTISAPVIISAIRSRSSRAAWRPTSGFAPAPKPLVSSPPIWITERDSIFCKAWESVLAQINSTPSTSVLTMCWTAFPPPPPTPITLITAFCGRFSTSSNMICSPSGSRCITTVTLLYIL